MKHRPASTTIGNLMRGGGWGWAYCTNHTRGLPGCGRRVALTYARFAILWGLDASSDRIRDRLTCTHCAGVGVQLITPSRSALGVQEAVPIDELI